MSMKTHLSDVELLKVFEQKLISKPKGFTIQRQKINFHNNTSHNNTIDLHGLTVQQAWKDIIEFMKKTPHKRITVITGKSGIIKKEFSDWMNQNPQVKFFSLRENGGSWEVILK